MMAQGPDYGDKSSSSSLSLDDIPSSGVRFESMARRVSTMSVDNIEVEEVAVWISLIDVIDQQSLNDATVTGRNLASPKK